MSEEKKSGSARSPGRMTIGQQVRCALIVVNLLAIVIFSTVTYSKRKHSLLADIDAKLTTVATMAREVLPPSFHDRITGPESVSASEFREIVDRNNRLCQQLGLEYIWSLMEVAGRIVFTSATSPDKNTDNNRHAKFFEPHSNPELYTNTFATMRATYKSNHDKWGDIRVALIPSRDRQGRKYLFGASVRLTDVERQLDELFRQSLLIGTGLFVFSLVVGFWVSRAVTNPIKQLTETIRLIAAGRADLEAEERGTVEQITLARYFNQMNRALQDKIVGLEAARQKLIGLHDAEIKQVEGSLLMSEQRYRALLDFAVDGILIGSHEGVITESNKRMCELFGMSREAIVGKHILEMPFTAESLKRSPFRFDLLQAGGMVVTERSIRRRDGSEITVEMHTKMMPDGTYQSIYHDISARKRDEVALKEIRRLLDETQSFARLGGWEVDFRTKKVTWTEEVYRIYGVGPEFDISDPNLAFSHYAPAHAPAVVKALTEGLSKGESCDLESELIRANGERIWVRVMGRPTLEEGELVRANGCIMDITARKKAEEALKETRRLLDEAQRLAKLGAWKYEVASGRLVWSDEVYRIHGVDRDFDTNDLEKALAFYAPESLPLLRDALNRAIERAEPFDLELEFIRSNGERIWVRAAGCATVEEDRVVFVSGSFMDINVRKQAELLLKRNQQELMRQNAMMSAMLQNLPVAVAMVDVPAGTLLVSNQACLTLLGLESLPSPDVKTVLSGLTFYGKSASASYDVESLPICRAMRGETTQGEEITLLRQDGSRGVLDVSAAPVKDAGGRIWAALACFADITERKRVEESLRETRRMLEEAQEIAKLGAWEYDVRTEHLTWTDEVYRIHGIGRDYDIDRLAKDVSFLVPEYTPLMWHVFEQAIKEGTPYDLEAELLQASGQRVWVRVAGRGVIENGSVVRVVGNIMDISERKQAETEIQLGQERLARQYEMLDALLQNLSVGVFMVEAPSGKPLVANLAARQLLGRGILPGADAHTLGDVYEAYQVSDRTVRYPVNQMPITLGMHGVSAHVDDLVVVRPDGSEVMLEIFGSPVKDDKGRVWASLVSFSDVTERKRIEQALRDSEDRYRQLFDMESDTIVLIDVGTGRFLDANLAAQTLYGYSREELLARGTEDLSAEPERSKAIIEKGVASGKSVLSVPLIHHRKKDGTVFPVEITGRFFSMNGRPVLNAAVRDITERKKVQDLLEYWNALLEQRVAERTAEVEKYAHQLQALTGRLLRAEEDERQRISDVLHEDLQQILVATRMTLGVALQSVKVPAVKNTLGTADSMLAQSIRLTRSLVQDIAVPSVREGELPFAVDWLRQQMLEKFNLEVEVVCEGAVRPVSENVYLCLYRAIQELLFNVFKYAQVNRVTVALQNVDGGDFIQVVVRDQGCGFSTEALGQAGKANKGFGLFSIRERLEGLGGRLEIVSEPGHGTTVTLTAPVDG